MDRALLSLLAGTALLLAPLRTTAAEPGELRLSSEDCRLLLRHRASPDTAYTPGLDVRGQAVAPADLDGGTEAALPESLPIVVTVDVAERLGLSLAGKSVEADAFIGVIELRGDALTFNGQPLTPEAGQALASRCESGSRKDAGP